MAPDLAIRRVGERRTWPFGRMRAEYEIRATEAGGEVTKVMTTSPSAVLATRFGLHTTDCYDWVAAADHAFQPHGEAWTSGPGWRER